MSAYWCSRVHVTDAETYANYAALAGPAIEKYGGVFLARGGKQIILEGSQYERSVVARFPSLEAAEQCYNCRNIRMHASIRSGRPSVIWWRWRAWIEALRARADPFVGFLNKRGRDRGPRDCSELHV